MVAVEGKIYAIGGTTTAGPFPDKVVGTVEVYDPVTDTWTTLASMPTPRSHFAIAAYQDKIYCIGGYVSVTKDRFGFYSYGASSVVEVYDTTNNTWIKGLARPPYSLVNTQALVVGGQIFVQMGFNNLFMFDPVTGVWSEKVPMPVVPQSASSGHRPYPAAFVLDGRLVFTGEFGPKNALSFDENNVMTYIYPEAMVLVYDPVFNAWSREVVGPLVLCDGVGLVTSGVFASERVYFLGSAPGSTRREVLTNQAYDFSDNSWRLGEAMPNPRLGFGAAVVDDILYIIGGYTYDLSYPYATSISALVEVYVPFGYRSVPVVEVVSPLSGMVYNVSSVELEFVVDRPVSQVYYCVDGGENVTLVDYNVTLSGLSGGVYNVTVFAEDKFGNVGVSETVVFTVVLESGPFLTTPIVVMVGIVGVIVVVALLVYFKRRNIQPYCGSVP